MKERVRQLGGKLEISSTMTGTTIVAKLPTGETTTSLATVRTTGTFDEAK
jgi:signal transduction histidine kinase